MKKYPLTYNIPSTSDSGKRWAISDLHGCLMTFDKLLDEIHFKTQDQLFLLGDLIDRGPDSKGLLNRIIELKESGYQIHCLRGNHEEMLLDHVYNYSSTLREYALIHGVLPLLDENEQIPSRFLNFFEELPYYFELDNAYLVHAGFNFEIDDPLSDTNAMIWTRELPSSSNWLNGKKLIHGHTPTTLRRIQQQLKNNDQIINIDNGCVFDGMREDMGAMLALNLNDYELLIMKNVVHA
ncbi:metallophosphoesterase family protein [Sediminitomix flava]|uniref:Serine/threonine protein phosphatase 1 n=1 Tax=Sediminitomix flava TaxID=379075 RepID=A0A315ZGG4_SEDFL|nr:metallophosphoesterase family protein [Sediminitomix flava]PWJ44601.1 serine/threonine protein phosphatase 1 [Sediminitomix flava]